MDNRNILKKIQPKQYCCIRNCVNERTTSIFCDECDEYWKGVKDSINHMSEREIEQYCRGLYRERGI